MPMDELKKLGENQEKLASVLPETMSCIKELHGAVLKDGALTTREKTLVGLGIAVSKQCKYCILKYVQAAIELNIGLDEILEACSVSMLMGGGPSVAYSAFVVENYHKITAGL